MNIIIYTGGTQVTFKNVTNLLVSSDTIRFDYRFDCNSDLVEEACTATFNRGVISGYALQDYED